METSKLTPATISGMIAFMGTGYFSPRKSQDIRNIIKSPVLVLVKPKSTDEILLFVKATEFVPPVTNDH
jgi:hypothetical protein